MLYCIHKGIMDYLDPNKKRAHKQRLLIGYGLFGIAIALATLLLVYIANGWFVDTSTGEVIRNGLVFVDSKPGGARVYLNGEQQRGLTDLRLVIPGDKAYDVEIKKDGYRDWSRSFQLEGGSLRKLTYARLIPGELISEAAVNMRANPVRVSQSIDKRWLIVSFAQPPLQLTLVDLRSPTFAHTTLELPAELMTLGPDGVVEVVEWSADNRHFLAKYTVGEMTEYLIIDRENPGAARNLNTLFGSGSYEVSLRDRKRDSYFVFDKTTGSLYTATQAEGLEENPFIDKKLLEFTTFGEDWVLYVTESGKEGLVSAYFKRGDDDILLKELKTGERYFAELAKLANSPVMAIASSAEDRAIVYHDPQAYMSANPQARIPLATTVLRVAGIGGITVSSDSSVVLAYGSHNVASHEFEADRSYNFELNVTLDEGQEPRWVDGQHLSFSASGKQYMTDFDGSNVYDLVESTVSLGSFFSEDIRTMYTFTAAAVDASGAVVTPPRINSISLLTPADR